ncbi:DUF4197 domain-containing protein [Roseateles saccharophilus]|uniref:Uncharacterized protein DUF4197 n=1 Tax=Roseateles saccharophilus TaxID=304 RepID=A0A4R3V2E9_ROSSA|nr:DUF4197 domain-containing protein [Roseateles saccharophilus]MDG0831956.1 DUF4197 domain-containing protein [Roseateles saccharophilus]TCU97378.1 uncharacterized protein DUF4197 [Roseateles saccharophilus]
MQRRLVLASAPALLLRPAWALSLTEGDANAGIRTALERGANSAVALLGRPDGFLGNPLVKIELPGHLKDAARLLRATGQGGKLDELVTAMNRAAEAAVPAAKPLLVKAVKDMSVEDGLKILKGGDDSITQFFAGKTREPLSAKFLPIVTQATQRVALADKYNAVASKASGFGLVSGEDANIQQYVTARALDGLYRIIGEEEKKIRQDPVGTGSAILKKVFGNLGG